jgi:RimJ/RimL family protein N-acetyltransferase
MIVGKKVKLREKRLADARDDYIWQTDPELARLDAMPLLAVPFAEYVLSYASQLRSPDSSRQLFSVETLDGAHIGNCTFYNVDDEAGEAELGIMIGDSSFRDRGYGTDTIKTLAGYIFMQRDLKRIYLKTLDWNHRAQKCFEKCGFVPYGQLSRDGHDFVLMELHREKWEKQRRNEGR